NSMVDELSTAINSNDTSITVNTVSVIVGETTYSGTINNNGSTGKDEWGIAVPPGSTGTLAVALSANNYYVKNYTKAVNIGSSAFGSVGSQQTQATAFDYATKVNLVDELGLTINATSAATLNVYVGNVTLAITNNPIATVSTNSSCSLIGGIAYMLVSPNGIGTGNVAVTANQLGLIQYTTGTTTLTDNASYTYSIANKYPLVISSLQSETGASIAITTNDVVRVTTVNAPLYYATQYSSITLNNSMWYLTIANNTTDATYNVRYLSRGYLWATDNQTVTVSAYNAASPTQQVVTYAKADGDGLKYTVKVAYAQDELGITLNSSALYFNAQVEVSPNSSVNMPILSTVVSGSEVVYLALPPSLNNVVGTGFDVSGSVATIATVNAFSNGYVQSSVVIAAADLLSVTGDQQVVSFNSTSNGLAYNLYVSSMNIFTQLGITINPTIDDDINVYTTQNASVSAIASSFNQTTGIWHVAVATETYKIKYDTNKYIQSGYSVEFSLGSTSTYSSARVTLSYPIKITLSDELGQALSITTNGIVLNSTSTVTQNWNIIYGSATQNTEIVIGISTSNLINVTASLTVPQTEYVNQVVASGDSSALGDFSNIVGSVGAPGAITAVDGLLYPLRVEVYDELGRPIPSSIMNELTLADVSYVTADTNKYYFNTVTASKVLTVNAQGYVVQRAKTVSTSITNQTKVKLNGIGREPLYYTAITEGGDPVDGVTNYANGLDYTARVEYVTDKLGTQLQINALASANIESGDLIIVTQNYSDGVLYLGLDAASTTNVSVVASGDVGINIPGYIFTTQNVSISGGTKGVNGKLENLSDYYLDTTREYIAPGVFKTKKVLIYRFTNTYNDSYWITGNTNVIGKQESQKGLDFAVSINANLIQNELGTVIGGLITPNGTNVSSTNFKAIDVEVYRVSGSELIALDQDTNPTDGISGYYVTINIRSNYPTSFAPLYPYTNLGWYIAVGATGNYKARLTGMPGYAANYSSQATVTYNRAQQAAGFTGSTAGLKYPLVVDTRTNVISNTAKITDGTVKYLNEDGTSINATGEAVGGLYYMSITQNGQLVITHNRYVDTGATGISPSSISQSVVVFWGNGLTAPTSIVGERATINGLAYPLSITLEDEIGNQITANTIVVSTSAGLLANVYYYDYVYYFIGLTSGIPEFSTLQVNKTGYVNIRSSEAGVGLPQDGDTNRTTAITLGGRDGTDLTTVDAGATVARNGFPYGLKLILCDEIGNALTANVITYGNTAEAASVNNTYYFAATTTQNLLVQKTGFVDITSTKNGNAILGAGTEGQTVVTLTGSTNDDLNLGATINAGTSQTRNGMKYGIKVIAAGPKDSDAYTYRFTIDGTTRNAQATYTGLTTVYSGGKAYVPTMNSGTALQISKTGYVSVTTTNIAASTQNVFSFTGTANGLEGKSELVLVEEPTITGLSTEGRVLQGGSITVSIQVANDGPVAATLNEAYLTLQLASSGEDVSTDYTVSLPSTVNFTGNADPAVADSHTFVYRVDVNSTATTNIIKAGSIFDATRVGSANVQAGWNTSLAMYKPEYGFTNGTWRVATDLTKPTVTIVSPESGTTVNALTVNLVGSIVDNAGVDSV
ncbi:beta strand repeat-containing protein, partial [Candidatus Margulisiibacteriota bacterium]